MNTIFKAIFLISLCMWPLWMVIGVIFICFRVDATEAISRGLLINIMFSFLIGIVGVLIWGAEDE